MRKELAHLDEVDWPSLHTAHGTAEHVPIALRALAGARDADQLFHAYWKLDNYIVLQGTVYESAYFAAPYILDILLSSSWAPLRVAAYDLLIEIARGVPDPGQQWTPGLGVPEDLRKACREIVASALDAYERDLASGDGVVRRRALDLLTSLGDLKGNLRTLLARIEPGEDVEFAHLLDRAKREL
jgi:hypothetical protein